MKYGTRRRMEWDDRRETSCMWERVGRKVGMRKIESMETMVWKYGKGNGKIWIKLGLWKIWNWRTLGKFEV